MPAYISHAIMADNLYEEAKKESNLFKINLNKDEIKGYSLGADLATMSNNVCKNPHENYTKALFFNMVTYIKENNLIEDEHIIALLYGHIAHYFFDINAHPLIFYIEKGCNKVGNIPNHHLVEGYISSYLSREILGKSIMEIKPDYFNKIDLSNKNVVSLINSIYQNVYNDPEMIISYKSTMGIFNNIEKVIKTGLFSEKKLIKLSKFNEFKYKNNLSNEEITNSYNETYTNPVTGEKHNESFIELYNKSLEMSLDAIEKVNECLYDGNKISYLDSVFEDLSYDTGVSFKLGNNMKYIRKKR